MTISNNELKNTIKKQNIHILLECSQQGKFWQQELQFMNLLRCGGVRYDIFKL